MRHLKTILHFFLVSYIFLSSCSSDYIRELSGGYFFRGEGGNTNDILCHFPNQREIPANIVRYNYNNDFIIAEQRPNKVDDPLYSKTNYKLGRDTVYYWLIVNADKLVIGPMDKNEYSIELKKYKVPEILHLKNIN